MKKLWFSWKINDLHEKSILFSNRIEGFPKHHDFEHGFGHCIEVICFSNCSLFVISTSSENFRLRNHHFSTSVANCLNTVIQSVRKLTKTMIFVNCINAAINAVYFSTHCRDFCRVRIEDFPKNQDFEHGFEQCIEVICFSNCSFCVI